jgi:citrate synthase
MRFSCAALLEEILAAPEGEAARAKAIARRHREARHPVPGFGHPHHKPDDPRSPRLIAIAEEAGVPYAGK